MSESLFVMRPEESFCALSSWQRLEASRQGVVGWESQCSNNKPLLAEDCVFVCLPSNEPFPVVPFTPAGEVRWSGPKGPMVRTVPGV